MLPAVSCFGTGRRAVWLSVLCFLVLQFTELISRESRGEATPEAFSSQSDLHLSTKGCSAVTMSKGSTSKDPT